MARRRGRRAARGGTGIHYSSVRILTGSDLSRRRLPLMQAEGPRGGPVVWLTACGHGDEVAGIVVIQDIFRRIRRQGLLRGRVCAFPLMNPMGFETGSRTITLSREDLNRSFPGSATGSVAERVAHRIFTAIAETGPALVLDLHSDWIRSIPYTVLDADPGEGQRAAYEATRAFATGTGFPVVSESEPVRRALSYSLIRIGVPALTLELGESYVVNEMNIEHGVRSIWMLLAGLGVVAAPEEAFAFPMPEAYRGRILRYSDRPYSSTSGIIRFLARAGDVVAEGQAIAKVYNAFGRLMERMTATREGLVLGHTDSSVAFPGVPVMAFGQP